MAEAVAAAAAGGKRVGLALQEAAPPTPQAQARTPRRPDRLPNLRLTV
ncbi:hypothetical protein AWB78_08709 [Caballeronia calidae]|uniref:Uncharacterized protein n=1 Tax=Caballeronia calidae TaxID=1777139 RepID=A0A158ELJ1_9BURK|nr:hypothetical protein AWB78_08709 [Caballeronia calidae]